MKKIISKKVKAFTLTEIMVVLVIIGILVLIALPNMSGLFSKAYSTEAKLQLKHLRDLQANHFQVNFKYTDDLEAIGFESPKTTKEGGTAKYVYEVVQAATDNFLARATAVEDFDGDGTYNVWEMDKDGNMTQTIPD